MDTDGSTCSEDSIFNKSFILEKIRRELKFNSIFNRNMMFIDLKNEFNVKVAEKLFSEQVLFTYLKTVRELNDRNIVKKKFPDGIKFCLLQSVKNNNKREQLIAGLAKFYNDNFIGNKDFIHIPSFSEIASNTGYPVIVAIRKNFNGKNEILGTTTIKFERSLSEKDNPYFPVKNKYVLSINGILTKFNLNDSQGKRIKGIGRELFEIAIAGAYEVSKYKPVSLMCKIDCRNFRSMNSILSATEELKSDGIKTEVDIDGYYELQGIDRRLIEAPTFVAEVKFNEKKRNGERIINFSYEQCKKETLYEDIKKVIQSKTLEKTVYINNDKDKHIIYHKIKPVNMGICKIDVGDSDVGNIRVPARINIFA